MPAREDFTATLTKLRPREALQPRPEGMVVRVLEGEAGRTVPLLGTRVLGGRTPSHPIPLSDPSVSATHFELSVASDGTVTLRDLGSKNGTRIHGVRVREAMLEPGTRFRVGDVELELAEVEVRPGPVSLSDRFGELLGRGIAMGKLFAELQRLCELPLDVLVRGETGTGKELVAKALHERSPRASAPFVVLDCTSLPATLAESLLFGHRRGAFTGAVGDARGYFEDASGGTLFIDEIAKLPLDLQGKLLRAVESREIARVGETRRRPVDVRIIAATNRDLAQMMADGEFLEDLYYRLGGIEIELPPLRERGRANLEFLASVLLERVAQTSQRTLALAPEVYDAMVEYPWPGNVRELARAMQRAVFWAEGELVRRADLRLPTGGAPGSSIIEDLLAQPYKEAMAQFEALLMKRVWSEVDGNISEAARRTGVDRRTLTKLVDGLGLRGAKDCT